MDVGILNEFDSKPTSEWKQFSSKEVMNMFNTCLLWYSPGQHFFEYGFILQSLFLLIIFSFSFSLFLVFFYLVMEDHVIYVHDYVTWSDIIGLEDSRRFWYDNSRKHSYSISVLWLEHGKLMDDTCSLRVEQLVQGMDHNVLV